MLRLNDVSSKRPILKVNSNSLDESSVLNFCKYFHSTGFFSAPSESAIFVKIEILFLLGMRKLYPQIHRSCESVVLCFPATVLLLFCCFPLTVFCP